MIYPLRLTLIVSDADRDEANQIAVEVSGREVDRNTYTVPLSPAGEEPATHWCCSTLANEQMGKAMTERMHRVPSVQWFTTVAQPGSEFLLFSNVESAIPDSLQQSGVYTIYNFDLMLEKMGLKRVQAPMETSE